MAIFQPERRTMDAAVASVTLQLVWKLVNGADQMPSEDAKEGEAPAVAEMEGVLGGGDELPTAAPAPISAVETQGGNKNKEAEVFVTTSPPATEEDVPRVPSPGEGEEVTVPATNPGEPTVTTTEEEEISVATPIPRTTAPAATAEAPTELPPDTTEPAITPKATTKPSLRTQDPTLIADTATNDATATQAPSYLDQGINPVVLIALGGICCVFLLLWSRKRRLGKGPTTSSTSGGGSSKGPKVQYTQVPEEQPFSHSQDDDDDEYCDEYEEDTFANDRDTWDDWESSSPKGQAAQLNPFASQPSAIRPTTPRQNAGSASPFKPSQPLPPPPPPPQQQHAQQNQLHEIAIASTGDALPVSVGSNSSSDSFEVVSDEVPAPVSSAPGATPDAEKEHETVDDLFSQFGMVPTFKKSAAVPPPPPAPSSATTTQASSHPTSASLPTAAEASALFAAEMDDELTAVDAADEWGEDDEWVKGI